MEEQQIAKIDLHWMGNYYGWCVAGYDADDNMICEEYEPQYYTYKADATKEAHRQACYYRCNMVLHTKTGKAYPQGQYIKGVAA